MKCPHCDLALTHHRKDEQVDLPLLRLRRARARPTAPSAQFDGIRYGGLGTQRLEAEVKARFPDVPCLRMDSDTMQKPGSHEQALARFRAARCKILLGTQMIAKGLDFPNVTLVGVVNADTALHLPDFRAAERTFQLVTQVAGRTGRGDKGGRVLVQTFTPDHSAILAAIEHDYARFAAAELPSRQEHLYPPFASLIRLIVRGESEPTVEQFVEAAGAKLRTDHRSHRQRASRPRPRALPHRQAPRPLPLAHADVVPRRRQAPRRRPQRDREPGSGGRSAVGGRCRSDGFNVNYNHYFLLVNAFLATRSRFNGNQAAR